MATKMSYYRLPEATLRDVATLARAEEVNVGGPGPGNGSAAVRRAVQCWTETLRYAAERNARHFTPPEWAVISRAAQQRSFEEPPEHTGMGGFIAARLMELHVSSRLGDLYLADGDLVDRRKVDHLVQLLTIELDNLESVRGEAIAYVVRRYWLHDGWPLTDPWWEWDYGAQAGTASA